MDAIYYAKKNEQREEKYQQVIDRNQQVIEEQAKAFGSISKDVTEIKQNYLKEMFNNGVYRRYFKMEW